MVAVYLGWRGKSTGALGGRLVLPDLLSFWGRKATALRVAGTSMTETLFGMLDALEKADETLALGHAASGLGASGYVPARSRSMIVGHSFGARVVENAFAQALIGSRLESQRMSNVRLRGAVASAKEARTAVLDREGTVEKRRRDLRDKQDELLERKADVETASLALAEAREELAGLITQEEAAARFAPYRSPSLGTVEARHCAEFDAGQVELCVGEAKDVWRVGSCLMDEVACMHRSYACSIHREIARRTEVAPPPSELSEWCGQTAGSSGEARGESREEEGEGASGEEDDDEQNPLVVVGEGDDPAEWEALARALKLSHDDLPSAEAAGGNGDEIPDWAPALEYLDELEDWADSWDILARIVEIWEKPGACRPRACARSCAKKRKRRARGVRIC